MRARPKQPQTSRRIGAKARDSSESFGLCSTARVGLRFHRVERSPRFERLLPEPVDLQEVSDHRFDPVSVRCEVEADLFRFWRVSSPTPRGVDEDARRGE
jgi:hypothetical protein